MYPKNRNNVTQSSMLRLVWITVASAMLLGVAACTRAAGSGMLLLPDQGCTIFLAEDGQASLGGNNEDGGSSPFARIWFLPAEDGVHGRVYIGYDNYIPQGGLNDQGLFFDYAWVGDIDVPPEKGKPFFRGNFWHKALEECATVECVIEMRSRYNIGGHSVAQAFLGDSTGDAAIVEPAVTLRKQGRYQVATNFWQSIVGSAGCTHENGCDRYQTVSTMLDSADTVSVELVRDALNATHAEGEWPTAYSSVYDLKRGLIYLYHFYDYENVVVLNLQKELAKGAHVYELASLFSENDTYARWAQPKIKQFEVQLVEMGHTKTDPSIYGAYVGIYRVPALLSLLGLSFDSIVITSAGDKLYLDIPGDEIPERELYPRSEQRFFHTNYRRHDEFEVTFATDGAGQAKALQLNWRGVSFSLRKSKPGVVGSSSWLTWLIGAWLVLAGGAALLLVRDLVRDWAWARVLWVLVVLLFGPLGLLAYLKAARRSTAPPVAWSALGSTLYSVTGTAIGVALAFVVFNTLMTLDANPLALLGVLYGLALIVGLLGFSAPLWVAPSKARYRVALRRALPGQVISVNAALTAIVPGLFGPIIMLGPFPYPVNNVGDPGHPVFWVLLVLAAIVGALFSYPVHIWMVRRGLVPWAELSKGSSPPRWQIIGAIVLTLVLLFAAVALLVLFSQ